MKKETLKLIIKTLENVASHDPTRQSLNQCLINKQFIIATDGHILSKTPHHDPSLAQADDIRVPLDELPYLKATLKMAPKYADELGSQIIGNKLCLEGKCVSAEGNEFPQSWPSLIPQYDGEDTIALDADLLMSLAKVVGTKDKLVRLRIKDNKSAVLVTGNGGTGVLMPVRM